jgi:hypothetical protein
MAVCQPARHAWDALLPRAKTGYLEPSRLQSRNTAFMVKLLNYCPVVKGRRDDK